MPYLICLFLSVSLLGCLKVKKIQESSAKEEFKTSSMDQGLIIPQENPNQYKVKIPLGEKTHLLRRSLEKDPESFQFITPSLEDNFFIDSSAVAGESYIYETGYVEEKEFQVIQIYQLQIPLDLQIQGEVVLTENANWNYSRIFFQKGSRVLTMGNRLNMSAEEILADEAVIETFPTNGTQSGQGRSGSRIEIRARTGKGNLRIMMRGENGAKGLAGDAGTCSPFDGWRMVEPKDGKSGGDGGSSGQAFVTISSDHQLVINFESRGGLAGAGGEGGSRCHPNMVSKEGPLGLPGIIQKSCLNDLQGEHCY